MSGAITLADKRAAVMGDLKAMQRTVLASLLTDALKPERFIQIIGDALLREPRLLECTRESIIMCARASAELGLELHSPLQHAFMVPYWSSKKGQNEAQFIPGYKGYVKLILESSRYVAVRSAVVYDGDDYDYAEGTEPRVYHVPRDKSSTPIAAYSVVHHTTGLAVPCWMWGREILEIEAKAEAQARKRNQWEWSPWKNNRAEMWRKCPIRRIAKKLDLTGRLGMAVAHDELADRRMYGQRSEPEPPRVDALKATLAAQLGPAADDDGVVYEGEVEP